jgi:alkylation response protein AidB-like acyl-CoA dehydrogenase
MNLMLTAEEDEVASAAALLLRRAVEMSGQDRSTPGSVIPDATWKRMADAGWFSLGVSPEDGGSGGGIGELVALFREVGRSLTPEPILGTVLAAQVAVKSGNQNVFEDVAAGTHRLALAWTENSRADAKSKESAHAGPWFVSGAQAATGLLVLTPEWAGVLLGDIRSRTLVDGIDPTFVRERVMGDYTNVAVCEGDHYYWLAVTLLAATLVGIGECGRDLSVEYAKDRQQFGEPIGAFQAVKHRCADMAVRSESAWSLTCYAAAQLANGEASGYLDAGSAKVIAARSAIQNAVDNVQNHGAMGFTDELGAHRLLRRAHALDNTLVQSVELLELLRQS